MIQLPARLTSVGLAVVLVLCGGTTAATAGASGPSVPAVCTAVPCGELFLDGFGTRLLAAVAGDGRESFLVSPLGVGVVLTMAAQGAKTPIRNAIAEILTEPHEPTETNEVKPATTYRLTALLAAAGKDDGITLRIANAAFADPRLDVYPAYSAALADRFGATVQSLDFADAATVKKINAWATQATDGAIRHLLSTVKPEDALVLVNALQFRGKWSQRFDPEHTVPLPFHVASGEVLHVETMRADDLQAAYRGGEDFKAVRLPYGGGEFVLTVVLPRKGLEPAAALGRLAANPSWLGGAGFRPARGSLALPRLSLVSELSLLPVLRRLGLETVLNDVDAFAGIAAPAPRLSRVVQAARLTVDEQGTEASAATAAVMTTRSALQDQAEFEMRVDRPFALAVRHPGTGLLLFVAWVAEPAGGR